MKTVTSNVLIAFVLFLTCDASAQWRHSNFTSTNEECYCLSSYGSKLYAGTYGNVIESTDNGVTWIALDSQVIGLQNAVISIACSGANVYDFAVTGDPFGTNGPVELWHSTDSGLDWMELSSNFQVSYPTITPMEEVLGKILYAFTSGGIYRSLDSGAKWEEVDTLSYASSCILDGKLFVGNSTGLFISTNQGNSWNQIQTAMNWPIQIVSNGSNMAALDYDSQTFSSSVFCSRDSGNTWSAVTNDSASTVAHLTNIAISGNTIFVGDAAAPGHDFYSNDWGASWHDLCEFGPGSDPDRGTALVVSGPNLVLTSSVTGIYYYQLGNIVDAVNEPVQPIKAISLSPNPTPGAVTIRGVNGTIIITNVLGQTVLTSTAQPDESLTLDLTSEPAGIYFVRTGTQSAKIVVAR